MNDSSNSHALYFRYWGKAAKDGSDYHLLPYHCLDVAAVGHILLTRQNTYRNTLAKLCGLDEKSFQVWVVFFLALHDIGKFAESFQNLRPDLLQLLQQIKSTKTYASRHDSLGYMIWRQHIRTLLQNIHVIPKVVGSARRQNTPIAFDMWALAVTGHHGSPPKEEGFFSDNFAYKNIDAAHEFVTDAAHLLIKDFNSLPQPDFTKSQISSWWLAGFSVLCDWLGSNTKYFPYKKEQDTSLADYWKKSLECAERAISDTELLPAEPAPLTTLQNLFSPYFFEPTPLQSYAADMPLGQGPQLCILEDVTGAGKTEAAVMIAHRLQAIHAASGIYFALPTMATANAMYERMASVYQRLFRENSTPPSLVLAHSARDLSKSFRQSILPIGNAEQNYGDNTEAAGAHCGSWLADNRKKALLAEIGVGTIDQALLGILPSRHQSLRLLGLIGKVLIVDEVHACDAYMHVLLCALLTAHTAAGGSSILLSATLPANQRRNLISAFNKGLNKPSLTMEEVEKKDYPLLTRCNSSGMVEQALPTRENVRRTVEVTFVHHMDEVEGRIEEALKQNRCVCWIRNTVNDARTSYLVLKNKHPDWSIDLFHARFAMEDRLTIENRIVNQFGKNSTPAERNGQLLIATQVVEQSLDLDFDLMITDLAPIDLIIQRAGRLHRHTRDTNGQVVNGPDLRGTPLLIINSPNPDQPVTEDWYSKYFKGASAVYENHGQLWLTAKLLSEKKGFRMPEDARDLIEGVYGDNAVDNIPEVLLENTFDAEGEDKAKSSQARLNALKLEQGYTGLHENRWWDDALTPTRLGDAMTTVYLARWEDGEIIPWVNADAQFPWPKSAVQLRRLYVSSEATNELITETIISAARERLPAKGKWGVLLPLMPENGGVWKGTVKNKANEVVNIYYSPSLGIIREPEIQQYREEHYNDI